MAVDIDRLQIQIKADATSADRAVSNLADKIDKLSGSLGRLPVGTIDRLATSVSHLGTAMQTMRNIDARVFSGLATKINSLANIDNSRLTQSANAIRHIGITLSNLGNVSQGAVQISEVAKNIAKLGGKNVTNAIANLPLLTRELNNMLTTLSRSPQISRNIIDMTNALANLASQGRNISTVTNSMVNGLNRQSRAMNTARRSSFNLASAFGMLYAKYFLVIRAVKAFGKAITSTSDYIEAYNYLTVSFGKIASEWDKDWDNYGSEQAQTFTNSFITRINENLSKMSGLKLEVSDDYKSGLLTSTGMKNLGLNIQEVTQYASQLASVTNSVGQTGEVSLIAAESFTKLGADMSSLFNVDYASVMGNLQSGLIGQSRALYKYGIDITNATLQTYAYELGLSKAVSEMTQAEKMQLRMIAILDQSKVAWGDLANTINSPSNMLRQFKNNLSEVGTVLGQLFIPIMQKAMPVINGLTIALRNFFVNLASIMGIKLDLDSFGQGYSDLEDDTSDLAGNLDDIASSAKKANAGLGKFDELNNINMSDKNGGGAGALGSSIDLTEEISTAAEEYRKAWDEAYAKMENKAEVFAKKVEKALEPVKSLFQNIAIGDWFAVGQDVTNIVVGITDFFTRAIANVDWEQIGENIGLFIKGIDFTKILSSIGQLIWEAINASIDQWKGMFDVAPIETTILTAFVGLPILSNAIKMLSPLITSISGLFAEGGIFGAGGLIASASTPILAIAGAISLLAVGLGIVYAKNEEVRESFANAVSVIGENLKPLLEVFTNEILPDLQSGWDGLLQIFKPLGEFLETVFVSIWQDMLNPALTYLGETVLPILTETLSNLWNNVFVPLGEFIGSVLTPIIEWLSAGLTVLWENVVVPLANALGNILGKAFEGIFAILNKTIIPVVNVVIDVFQFLWNNVLKPIVSFVVSIFGPAFESAFEMIGGIIDGLSKAFGGLIDFITGVFTGDWEKAWNGVKDVFKGIFNVILSVIEGVVNLGIDGLNIFLGGLNGIVTKFGDIIGIDIGIPTIQHIDIPAYATGGFPEDGLFYANRTELVGQFSNGRTAVANNAQIVSGIEGGVERAVTNVLAPYLAQIAQNTRETADKEFGITEKQIFNANRSQAKAYTERTGKPAFS